MQGTQGGWVALTSLNLSNNTLTGTLPADWNAAAAMPVMQVLPTCWALLQLLNSSLHAQEQSLVALCTVASS